MQSSAGSRPSDKGGGGRRSPKIFFLWSKNKGGLPPPPAPLLDPPLQSVGGKLSSHGVLLVLFSFCFLVKVAWVYDPSGQGKYPSPGPK